MSIRTWRSGTSTLAVAANALGTVVGHCHAGNVKSLCAATFAAVGSGKVADRVHHSRGMLDEIAKRFGFSPASAP
jgi:hypothetical protein